MDVKGHQGVVEVIDVGAPAAPDDRLRVGNRDRSRLVEDMAWQVDAVRRTLESGGTNPLPPVVPVLCFVNAEWPDRFPVHEYRAVRLESPLSLRLLLDRITRLDPSEVERLSAVLTTALPP